MSSMRDLKVSLKMRESDLKSQAIKTPLESSKCLEQRMRD